MYLHLGQDTIIRECDIIGIFDMDNTTTGKKTRDFLARLEKQGRVRTVSFELPKSFVLCVENGEQVVYLSQLSTSTLLKRTGFVKKLGMGR